MIGCDGIFERLNNRDCIDAVWERINEQISISNKIGGGDALKGGKRDAKDKRNGQGTQNANRKQLKAGLAGGNTYNEH